MIINIYFGVYGADFGVQPTEELSFADAHLYAYFYIYDKKAGQTAKDVKGSFIIEMKDEIIFP